MRRHQLFIIILFGALSCVYSQNKQLLYDFTDIPQALMVNPGMETNFSWYVGIPALSGISLQAGSSGLTVDDIFADDGLDVNDKVRDRAINGQSIRDELSGTYQVELLNVGFRGKDENVFYSFGIYNEGDAIGYWFKDYAILAFEGNAGRLNDEFDLSHLKTRGEMLNVFHFGVNKKMNKKLTVGARAKIYSSIFDFNSTKNEGFFVTTEGQNNILASTLDADLRLRTSGLNEIEDAIDNENLANTLLKRAFFGGNLGLGFDIGFTYNFDRQTLITASLLDVGFIYHTNDVKTYTLQGRDTVEGVEIFLPQDLLDLNQDFYQDLIDRIEESIPFEDNNDSYIAFRPTKLNASFRYNFGKETDSREDCDCADIIKRTNVRRYYSDGVGAQLYVINRPRGPQAALTAFYLKRLGKSFSFKTTYTVDKFSLTNLGLGLNVQAGPVNFYGVFDNLLAYRNIADTHYASFQLRLSCEIPE
ncbi:MAG: DUF5723 family protein [Bacteroidota bacterium]